MVVFQMAQEIFSTSHPLDSTQAKVTLPTSLPSHTDRTTPPLPPPPPSSRLLTADRRPVSTRCYEGFQLYEGFDLMELRGIAMVDKIKVRHAALQRSDSVACQAYATSHVSLIWKAAILRGVGGISMSCAREVWHVVLSL